MTYFNMYCSTQTNSQRCDGETHFYEKMFKGIWAESQKVVVIGHQILGDDWDTLLVISPPPSPTPP